MQLLCTQVPITAIACVSSLKQLRIVVNMLLDSGFNTRRLVWPLTSVSTVLTLLRLLHLLSVAGLHPILRSSC
jgi:hypothetical protein